MRILFLGRRARSVRTFPSVIRELARRRRETVSES
jgi:hypothetical protein